MDPALLMDEIDGGGGVICVYGDIGVMVLLMVEVLLLTVMVIVVLLCCSSSR